MKMSGEEIIPAPIEAVWHALNDVTILQQCIPGCESITKTSDTAMTARVVIKIGPVKAGFNGHVQLKDLKPPFGYRIEGKGEGGLAGHASGGASVQLETVPEGTRMTYDVDAQVGGKMAMLGSRLIDSTARSLAGQFFDKFAELAAHVKVATGAKALPKKRVAAKTPKKKTPAKKVAPKKAVTKKAPVKKGAAKKSVAKKSASKKSKR
jgi:uncharacterized protein